MLSTSCVCVREKMCRAAGGLAVAECVSRLSHLSGSFFLFLARMRRSGPTWSNRLCHAAPRACPTMVGLALARSRLVGCGFGQQPPPTPPHNFALTMLPLLSIASCYLNCMEGPRVAPAPPPPAMGHAASYTQSHCSRCSLRDCQEEPARGSATTWSAAQLPALDGAGAAVGAVPVEAEGPPASHPQGECQH
jgi:hypothetical protein